MSNRFIEESRAYLLDQYLPRIRLAVTLLSEEDVWWRPVAGSNSIGNLILHIEGNARQWLLGGVGRQATERDRDAEFSAVEGRTKAELLASLTSSLLEIDRLLATVTESQFDESRVIQGDTTTVFGAIYHVVEHVSMHTGQIIQLAKWRAPGMLKLYDATSDAFTPLWSPTPRE